MNSTFAYTHNSKYLKIFLNQLLNLPKGPQKASFNFLQENNFNGVSEIIVKSDIRSPLRNSRIILVQLKFSLQISTIVKYFT